MSRAERHIRSRTKRNRFIQIFFFGLFLTICLTLMYFLNVFPFQSGILGYDRLNILAVGTDSVEANGRADTILILSLDPKTKDAVLFSIPRDMRVLIPNKGLDKINHAFAYRGIDLLEKTVEEFTGLSIHYYGVIDFESFRYIIDALDGVNIFVEKEMHYTDRAGSLRINLNRGQQILDGEKALEYVRFRSDALGDLGRIQRQQKLINAVIDKVLNMESFAKIPTLINNLTDYIDTNMHPNDIVTLARIMKNVDRSKIWVETIHGEPQYIDGISYLVPDVQEVKSRIQNLLNNKYRGLKVEVLNGSQIPGMANQVAQQLKKLGFDVANVDNADNFDYQKTVLIVYAKNVKLEEYITQAIGDVEIVRKEQPHNGIDMTIIVGKNIAY